MNKTENREAFIAIERKLCPVKTDASEGWAGSSGTVLAWQGQGPGLNPQN
jgi:hypothetical protein